MRLLGATTMAAVLVLPGSPGVAAGATRGATTVRVSVSTTGAQGNDYADGPALSGNGRYVAFYASSANLVPGDTNGVEDVFVRDRRSGVTRRVSVTSKGLQGNAASAEPAISPDGRFVAFHSGASNLVPCDTNGVDDVFVHDLRLRTTRRISVSSAGVQGDQESGWPAMSPDGRFVVFHSRATNLVARDTNANSDVFLYDLRTRTTRRVSVSSSGAQAVGQNENAGVSAGGRYVVFWSTADNLVRRDTNGLVDVFVRDVRAGTTTRVSVSDTEQQALSDGPASGSFYPGISADGRWITFVSGASNLVHGDTNRLEDAFVRDRRRGTTTRISVSSRRTQADGYSYQTKITPGGRYVVFGSAASNLVPGDTNAEQDVFVHDLRTRRTIRESVTARGAQANSTSLEPAISADGRHVGFLSLANNLVPNDTNDRTDVFVRDL
ncbi:TolB family protein [Actinoplanes sp. NPDC004185]